MTFSTPAVFCGLLIMMATPAYSENHDSLLAKVAGNIASIGVTQPEDKTLLSNLFGWFDRELNSTMGRMYTPGTPSMFKKVSALNNFEVRSFDGFGRGIATKRPIEAGELSVVVPCSVGMSVDSAHASPIGPELVKLAARQPGAYYAQEMVALQLVYEALTLERSFWRPYIELLPKVGARILPMLDVYRAASAIRAVNLTDNAGYILRQLDVYDAVVQLSQPEAIRTMDARRRIVVDAARAVILPLFARDVLGVPVRVVPRVDVTSSGGGTPLTKAWDGVLPREGGEPVTSYLVEIDGEYGGARLLRRLVAMIDPITTWAYDIIRSRAWSARGCSPPHLEAIAAWQRDLGGTTARDKYAVLIPIMDLLNHDSTRGKSISNWQDNGSPPTSSLPSKSEQSVPRLDHIGWALVNGPRALSPGEQLHDSYEDELTLCNFVLLNNYAFTRPDEAGRDCLRVHMQEAPSEPVIEMVVRAGEGEGDERLLPYRLMQVHRRSQVKSRKLDPACETRFSDAVSHDAPLSLASEAKALRMWRRFLLGEQRSITRKQSTLRTALADLAALDGGRIDHTANAGAAAAVAIDASMDANNAYDGFDLPWASLFRLALPSSPSVVGALEVSAGEARVVQRALAAIDRRWLQVLHADIKPISTDASAAQGEALHGGDPSSSDSVLARLALGVTSETRVVRDVVNGACIVEDRHMLDVPTVLPAVPTQQ